ncbi:NADPH-dependent ferric siderophore reductase [Mycolicibacterium agri]|uniref:NADPH-dependent ferric siderophore reductase n=1 Tax=Mycolicibacterium agri TaxID=36811 RepID=A0A2A7NF36_MYCAG|nr:siderophore-interacting protein [Mycolicibacterium agri]PEG42041.1 NADPH-dependent ferric siderophore reductase [Mycolicibacterium agri]GFG49800.1 siderophore-interacting protein [Mycolicibacterium agri]
MSFSHGLVTEAVELGPRLRRVVVRVDDPAALDVKPAADSAVGVYFPIAAPDGTTRIDPTSEGRNYSVRYHDGDRITLDIFLHAHGPGTSWAATASAGGRVGLDHARSWYRPPASTEWQLLVTDLSGLPATARIVEESTLPVTVIAEVADREDLEYLPRRADMRVITTVGTGNGHAPSRLAELVRAYALPAGQGYCWFAGEAAESRAVRKHFRAMGWTIDQLDVTGYWRFDSETWDARFAEVEDEVVAVYTRALAQGKGDKVASEEFDEALERVGL